MKKLLILFGLYCMCATAFAQQQYTITNFTQEQGLQSGTISGIYKDTTGYIWLTSEEGVARFDGYNFKVFRHLPGDSTSLPNDIAWYGAFPRYGDIYFETQGKFCKYNPATASFTFKLPFGDSLDLFRIFEVKGVSDHYWALSNFSIFKISRAGTQYFALPYPIAPKEWSVIASADNRVLLSHNLIGKPHLLFLDEKSKTMTEVKILDSEGREDSSTFADVFFTDNDFYLFNKRSVFRFNSVTRAFEWHFDLKHRGNFDYAFQFYLPLNDSLVIIRSQTGFLNIINIRTGEEQLVYVNKRIPEQALTDRMILNCTADNNGGVWLGTAQMGIIHYSLSTGELTQYIHEPGNPISNGSNSLPGNMIDRILVDDNGVLWASCFGHGLIKMEPVTALFKTAVPSTAKDAFTEEQGWSANIRGFLETDDGYWVATMNGLFSYSGETQKFSNLQSLCPANIETRSGNYDRLLSQGFPFGSLARDHAGNIWIGTWYGELVIYNINTKRSYSIKPPPLKKVNESIFRNLFFDRKNRMWISTWHSGICMVDCNDLNFEKMNDIKFEYSFPDANDAAAIPPGIAFVVSEDAQGNIWAGTENGLCRYNEQTKKWKRYVNIPGNEKSIHHNNVRSLCLDKNGNLWVGTNGGGLNRYNKEQDNFTHFTKANGLPDDRIYTLVCDNNGMLWMGTNHGLSRFNPMDFSCKNFSEKDGIQNYEYNTGAAIKLKDGTLLIGGITGYNIIDPDKIENKKLIPPVVISSFKIFDKEIPIGNGQLNLNYDENRLSFEFAALSYFRNQKNRYAYMLEGVDPDWIFSDTRRYVTYSKLEPGQYTFKVKACNSDGVWNETGTQLQITITPPWWQRTWFILLCFLVTFAIIYFINRYEQNRQKQMEAVRARISRDLHDDMGSTLQSISVMSEIARMKSTSNTSESIPILEKIGSASREMVEKMNDIVWAVNPQNDHFENIILHMRAFGGELLAGKDIALHFKSDSGLNNIRLSMEKRKSFFLVYKEALNNAYKYSGAKNVNVEISKTNHTLKLVVEDDGVGFNINEDRLKTGGNGLKNMNTRAAELNGNISIHSQIGQGTTVSLTVNLK